jgi:hypothetical protein
MRCCICPVIRESRLERALCIPALSAGWRASFQALLEREQSGGGVTGNPGLTPAAGPPPAWTGFRPLRVSRKDRESASLISLVLEPTDGPSGGRPPRAIYRPALSPAPDGAALLRSYSLSGEPRDERYRVSIKRETHCAAGTYVDTQVQVGDVVDASASRGSFTLRPGGGPVVLLSAGVGATPVLAMLHALSSPSTANPLGAGRWSARIDARLPKWIGRYGASLRDAFDDYAGHAQTPRFASCQHRLSPNSTSARESAASGADL